MYFAVHFECDDASGLSTSSFLGQLRTEDHHKNLNITSRRNRFRGGVQCFTNGKTIAQKAELYRNSTQVHRICRAGSTSQQMGKWGSIEKYFP